MILSQSIFDTASSHPDQLSMIGEDMRNMSTSVIHKIWKNMFDQDSLETFLFRESEECNGFKYFLRKYKEFEERIEKNGEPTGKRLADF